MSACNVAGYHTEQDHFKDTPISYKIPRHWRFSFRCANWCRVSIWQLRATAHPLQPTNLSAGNCIAIQWCRTPLSSPHNVPLAVQLYLLTNAVNISCSQIHLPCNGMSCSANKIKFVACIIQNDALIHQHVELHLTLVCQSTICYRW